jgi:DNA-binding PadR family transcriptional regulator
MIFQLCDIKYNDLSYIRSKEIKFLMKPETLMLYKLIVLYILDRVDFPMSNAQLTKFITEREYTNYFNIQQVFSELVDDHYITMETSRSQTLYKITDEGRETLSFFYKQISKDIRDDIEIYLAEEKYALREEVSSFADYYESALGEYVAELKILERDNAIIELKLSVPTISAAQTICDKWKQKNADIYAYVLDVLLKDNLN